MNWKGKGLLVAVIVLAFVLYFALDLQQYLSLSALKAGQDSLQEQISRHPLLASSLFMLVYILAAALSLPGAAILTLAGGALFGLVWGLVMVSFASSIGASLAFLGARYLFRDSLRRRYRQSLARIDRGIERDGAFYLASLRLVPIFPFFVINLVMGLTAMRLRTFYWVSQLGMFAGTVVYVNAGTQLGRIDSLGDVLSPALLGSFLALALFPLLAKTVLGLIQRRRQYRGYQRPHQFDYNLAVIGAGSAGLVSSYIAAAVKAKVALIERERMGGDCLNTGCVPSKALIRSARVARTLRDAEHYGLTASEVAIPFERVMERVQQVVAEVAPHDSAERYQGLGVDCISGGARFVDPWTLEISPSDDEPYRLTARAMVIATGGRPAMPPIPGLDQMQPLTSDSVWRLRQRPERLLVLGGGADRLRAEPGVRPAGLRSHPGGNGQSACWRRKTTRSRPWCWMPSAGKASMYA